MTTPILTSQWRTGPVGDRLIDAHERPINCMALKDTTLVTGSSDHGLKIIDTQNGKIIKELFNKKYGHKEWVTCVSILQDGRIISGAMDCDLCLWHNKKTSLASCDYLKGHRGSISQVAANDEYQIALSSSYDKKLKVWDLKNLSCIYTLEDKKGHTKGVQNFFWKNSLVVSGGRDGLLCVWDINTAQLISILEEHSAPTMAIDVLSSNDLDVLVSGAMDGYVCVWDLRTSGLQQKVDVVNGSVNAMKVTNWSDEPEVIVGGSDKLIKVLDPKKNFQSRQNIQGHKDIVTCLSVCEDLVFSGGGNGWVLVHELDQGSCLYGVGATEQGQCNCIEIAAPSCLAAGGEDGKVILFDYE